jgi:hypothetical protein
MSRPGVEVTSAASAPPVGVPTDTSVAFIVAEAAMGPTDLPTRVTSMDQFAATYGGRVPGTYGYDALDAAFHEGLGSAYFLRVSDGGVVATKDATALTTAASVINAANPGAWANGLVVTTVTTPALAATDAGKSSKDKSAGPQRSSLLTYDTPETQAGGTFMATVALGGKVVQTSLPLTTAQDLANFLSQGNYARLTGFTPTSLVAAGSVTLAGGANGTLPMGSSALANALDNYLPAELGPGQVYAPGRTTLNDHAALLVHASTHNRVAFLDGGVGDDNTILTSMAASLRGSLEDRYGSLWGPWAVIPGIAPGTTRQVPWGALQLGIVARNDATGHVNQAGAGSHGESRYAVDLVQTFTEQEMEDLLYAGVNTARRIYGAIEAYAFRTLVDPAGVRSGWRELNHARLNMAIVAQSEAVGEDYVFGQIDGRGHLISAFGGALAGMLIGFFNDDALFGDDATEAFVVNVGASVNTPAKLADGILSAVLSVRMSPHAELVQIQIVKVPITVAVAA